MKPSLVTWAIVASYLIFIFVKGVSKAKKVQNVDDFLVAGRRIGWFFLFCTMGATVIGGGASVGAMGRTYEWGVLMLLVSSGWYLHFIFSGLVVAPVFRQAKLYTVAGYFGLRFGEGPRFVVTALSILFSLFIVAAQMAAFGSVLSAIVPAFAGNDVVLIACIVVGGLMVVGYSTAGGLIAVIHTDVYQFIILLVGLVVTLVSCVPDLLAVRSEEWTRIPASFFALDGGKGWGFAVTTFLAFLLGETFAPGYATRYCVGKDIRETRLGIAGVGVFLALVFPVILFCIALYARLHFPNIDSQQVLPRVVAQVNNSIVSGMMLGALLMAVMSSADSALNSATAIFIKDLFEHQLRWKADDATMLRRARLCSVLLGVAAIVVAAIWRDVIDMLLFTYHLWAPAIIVPVCVGVFSKASGPTVSRNILLTMVVAIIATLLFRFSPLRRHFDPSVFGVAVSLLAFGLLRLINPPPRVILPQA